jgi:hypothetical protein
MVSTKEYVGINKVILLNGLKEIKKAFAAAKAFFMNYNLYQQ